MSRPTYCPFTKATKYCKAVFTTTAKLQSQDCERVREGGWWREGTGGGLVRVREGRGRGLRESKEGNKGRACVSVGGKGRWGLQKREGGAFERVREGWEEGGFMMHKP